MRSNPPVLLASLLCVASTNAFVFAPSRGTIHRHRHLKSQLPASIPLPPLVDRRECSFVLSDAQVKPIIRLGKGDKKMVINAFGLWCAAVSLVTLPIWSAAMCLVNLLSKINKKFDANKAIYDKTGKIWAKTWLTMIGSYPTFSGDVDRLKGQKGPCLFVANHASWMDIPILCTVLDPTFKFIAKGSLRKVPCIGQQLAGGNHILIDREDRRSQIRTFKEAIGWLKKGIPIMAFPEGRRSPDGRLLDFKGGLFSMAKKTNVPIVPISISHAHAIHPGNSLFPVQRGKGKLHVHIHDPIDASDKTEAELAELVRLSLLSELPFVQHPIVIKEDGTPGIHAANTDTETTIGDGVQAHAEIVIPMDIPAMKQPTAATPQEPEQA